MPMIISPTSKNGVELFKQGFNRSTRLFTYNISNFSDESLNTLLGWGNMQCITVFTKSLPQERKSMFDVSDTGLLLREFETSFTQELFQSGFYMLFQNLFRFSGNNKVISIPHEIDSSPSGHSFLNGLFQTVQRHIRYGRANNSALRSSFQGR